jgi:hypothetical protein
MTKIVSIALKAPEGGVSDGRLVKENPYEPFDASTTQAFIYNNQTVATQRMLDFDYVSGREHPLGGRDRQPDRQRRLRQGVLRPPRDADPRVPQAGARGGAAPGRRRDDQLRLVPLGRGVDDGGARPAADPHRRRHRRGRAGAPLQADGRQGARRSARRSSGPPPWAASRPAASRSATPAGTIENIVESKLHRPGSVGFVSKSGGLSNEEYYTIAMNTDGLYEGIAIGGDAFPARRCSTTCCASSRSPR